MKAKVTVVDKYRLQGFFTLMRNALLEKYPHVTVLLATSVDSALPVYSNPTSGWKLMKGKQFVLATEEKCASPLTELPRTGSVIAVCPVDFYKVSRNKEAYHSQIKYYVCDFEGNRLKKPIFNQDVSGEHYLGLYKDGEFITEGKVKHLFEAEGVIADPCLVLSKLVPQRYPAAMFDKESAIKMDTSGFFSAETPGDEAGPPLKRARAGEGSAGVVLSSSAGFFAPAAEEEEEESAAEFPEPGAASGGGRYVVW